jgi:hypothetical protein
VFAVERRVILMASKASPSETLAWSAHAAQARRVAGMLSPRDAQLAEAYPPSEIGEIVPPSAVEDKTPPPVTDWTERFTGKEVV